MKKAAWQKIAWSHLVHNDVSGYRSAMRSCLQSGSLLTDEDKAAQSEATSDKLPDRELLMARLAFDGGYYQTALRIVQAIPSARLDDEQRVERSYRLARIQQAIGQYDAAMSGYRNTILQGRTSHSHFAANSALQMGVLFEGRSQIDSARTYYQLCLSLPDHGYKNSLDQKAKAALQRIGATR